MEAAGLLIWNHLFLTRRIGNISVLRFLIYAWRLLNRNLCIMKVPNVIHFIFGLREDFGGTPFSFIHYLAIRSALETNKPDKIFLYYEFEPFGLWWEKSKDMVELVQVKAPESIFDNPLNHPSHRADVLRLNILQEHGGIYLDMDVICLKPFEELRSYNFVLGQEKDVGLCNAVILSEPGAEFLKIWLEQYRSFRSKGFDEFWNEHAVKVPSKLAEKNPDLVHIEENSFFNPLYSEADILWTDSGATFEESFCMHLWEKLWWDKYLKDLSPEFIKTDNSCFSQLCRQYGWV